MNSLDILTTIAVVQFLLFSFQPIISKKKKGKPAGLYMHSLFYGGKFGDRSHLNRG